VSFGKWFSNRGKAGRPGGQSATSSISNAHCSFCRKNYRAVGPLVEGPGNVFICGDCITRCSSVLDAEKRRRGSKPVRRLADLAHGRSGDKGNHANIGIACFDESGYRELSKSLTAELVKEYFAHLGPSRVVRYELPNLLAFNFVLYDVLDGGASRSLHIDSQGKTLALQLLEMEAELTEGP